MDGGSIVLGMGASFAQSVRSDGGASSTDLRNGESLRFSFGDGVAEPLRDGSAHSQVSAAAGDESQRRSLSMDSAAPGEDVHHGGSVYVCVKDLFVNSLTNARTSSGYPAVVTTGAARGHVYGAFVDLRNPAVAALPLPPEESYIELSPAPARHAHHAVIGTPPVTPSPSGLFPSLSGGSSSGGVGNAMSMFELPPSLRAAATPMLLGIRWRTTLNLVSAISPPQQPASPTTLLGLLQQYPDGIHTVQSSPLCGVLLGDRSQPMPPSTSTLTPPQPPAEPPAAETHQRRRPVEPFPEDGRVAAAPLQRSLVVVNSFNHLTAYVVRHQGHELLDATPIQTVSASLSTRKITTHTVFFVTSEEASGDDGEAGVVGLTSPPRDRATVSSPPQPAVGGPVVAGAVGRTLPLIDIELKHPASTAAASATNWVGQGVTVGIGIEPLILLGNQRGDIIVFSISKEAVAFRLNYGGPPSANGASPKKPTASSPPMSQSSVAGPGAFTQLVNSPVSCLVEVRSGVEDQLLQHLKSLRAARNSAGATVNLARQVHPPASTFAAGFDSGHVLLLSISVESACVTHTINNFGCRPLHAIATRLPPLFVRLWPTSMLACDVDMGGAALGSSFPSSPAQAPPASIRALRHTTGGGIPYGWAAAGEQSGEVVASTTGPSEPQWAVVSEDELHDTDGVSLVAIASDGGTIHLARLPGLETAAQVQSKQCESCGEVLALEWVPSTACSHTGSGSDLLVASCEDDSLLVFRVWVSGEEEHHARTHQPCRCHQHSYHHPHRTSLNLSHRDGSEGGLSFALGRSDLQDYNSSFMARLASPPSPFSGHVSSPPSPSGARGHVAICLLQRLTHHHSWVNCLSAIPVFRVTSLAAYLSSRGLPLPPTAKRAGPRKAARSPPEDPTASVVEDAAAMPVLDICGSLVMSTGYDGETAFWATKKYLFYGCSSACGVTSTSSTTASGLPPRPSEARARVIRHLGCQPAMSASMDRDLALHVVRGGAGVSHFAVSVSCRGIVKFWELRDDAAH